jgi:hypothetical protein
MADPIVELLQQMSGEKEWFAREAYNHAPDFAWVVEWAADGTLERPWAASEDPEAMIALVAITADRSTVASVLAAVATRSMRRSSGDVAYLLETARAVADGVVRGAPWDADVSDAVLADARDFADRGAFIARNIITAIAPDTLFWQRVAEPVLTIDLLVDQETKEPTAKLQAAARRRIAAWLRKTVAAPALSALPAFR